MSSLTNTYWGSNGKEQRYVEALNKLVPDAGEVKGPGNEALEKFRAAGNCYYDLYNNGLCNRPNEFRRVFGLGGMAFVKGGFNDTNFIQRVEDVMSAITLAAAKEQGLLNEEPQWIEP